MVILQIEHLKNFIEANPLPSIKPYYSILNKPLNQKRSEAYQKLLSYLTFHDFTKIAIEELKQILRINSCLEQPEVKQWTRKNLKVFHRNLFLFGVDYFETDANNNDNIYLSWVDEYVDKVPFQSIIKFWECMWLLYFGQYHVDKEKRSGPDPVGSYYYSEPDPNALSDFEKLSNYLKLD